MKKLRKVSLFMMLVATFNIVAISAINATTYVCQNDECTTTIRTNSNGYTWSIICDDGSTSSGSSSATYSGECQEQPGEST